MWLRIICTQKGYKDSLEHTNNIRFAHATLTYFCPQYSFGSWSFIHFSISSSKYRAVILYTYIALPTRMSGLHAEVNVRPPA